MKFTGEAYWTEVVNWLEVECEVCAKKFYVRADRWRITCPRCSTKDDIGRIRRMYAEQR